MTAHQTVLLQETIAALNIQPAGIYVDATFGRGGHSAAILAQLNDQGRLLMIDKDPAAIQAASERFADDTRVVIQQGSFADLETYVTELGWHGKVDGICLDLGVSSPQLDTAARGFSFQHTGPLDMRMDPTQGLSAQDWLATASAEDIADVLYHYGEERFSRRIARAIVEYRDAQPLTTTTQLADIIAAATPKKDKFKHPATRSFQAIRIFINQELSDLETCLSACVNVLKKMGRLAVITFHSLEDRIVKQFIKKAAQGPQYPKDLPIVPVASQPRLKSVGKFISPSEAELAANTRSRSAKLRIAEKVA